MARPRRDHRPTPVLPELDDRFPSGPWIGFYLDRRRRAPHRRWLDLALWFYGGKMLGRGRDRDGSFVVEGSYTVEDGRCTWTLKYGGKHQIRYEGFNEGQGIYGAWSGLGPEDRGGFRIWPEGMAEPSGLGLSAREDLQAESGHAPALD